MKEYFDALEEAARFMKADRLRQFFVMLSAIGSPVPEMWEKYKANLCEDFLEHFHEDEERAYKLGLIHIDRCLRRHGSSLLEAGLPVVEDDSTEFGRERLQYSVSVQNAFVEEWESLLSSDQSRVFDYFKLLMRGEQNEKVLFLDGPGGSG
ncbi:hypothetical protein L0F63_007192 [Massospora cicadina]|nr:hypothetical protein L0F63_007192 [Massospora cicadina]